MTSTFRLFILSLSLATLMTGPALADSPLTIVHAFDSAPDGAYPDAPLVQGADGNFYGTASGGTSGNGAVFKMTPEGVRTTLVAFDGVNNGANPNGLCKGADGNFYGTTKNGGFYNKGTIFKMTPAGDLTTILSFSGPDGAWPVAGLTRGVDGNFYGTTYNGGVIEGTSTNIGTIFKITPAGELTTLHVFDPRAIDDDGNPIDNEGSNPSSTLLLARDGNFYGVTPNGGENYWGALFRITPTGDCQTMLSFGSTDFELMSPTSAPIQGADGFFYGTAPINLGMNSGGIYKMSASGVGTDIYDFQIFDGTGPTGAVPNGLLLGSDGSFYGTAQQLLYSTGGQGAVFKMDKDYNVTILAAFTGDNGGKPTTSLIQTSDGNLYGTTYQGGTSNVGTVFKITTSGSLTSLSSFVTLPVGALPKASLLLANDGNLYGTTERGGSSDAGTVFSISPSWDFTTLAIFTAATGAYPSAKLIQATDGNFYGTTSGGGDLQLNGSVFKMTPDGTLSLLATFPGFSGAPNGSVATYPDAHTSELVQGADGNFFGINGRGINSSPVAFEVGPSLAFKILATFDILRTAAPYGGFTLGTDGNLYAATNSPTAAYGGGGSRGPFGLILSMTQTGGVTNLVKPDRAKTGSDPYAAMLQGPNGNFYGTMSLGGAKNMGTIFQVSPDGFFSLIATFDGGVSGKYPRSGLILGQDGRFYGTTYGDPANGDYGTIFSVSDDGDIVTHYRFSGADGSSPLGLVQHPDGTFYGVTTSGGPAGAGEVFAFKPAAVITFPPISAQVVTDKLTLAAKTSTGAPVKFAVLAGPATLNNTQVSFTAPGSVTVQASQVVPTGTTGTVAVAEVAPPVTQTFTVGATPQTIKFPSITDQIYPGQPVQLQATASSGLPVTYTFTGPITLVSGVVRVTGVGHVTITALQRGNATYAVARPVTIAFNISRATDRTPQTITFPEPGNPMVGTPYTLAATASSGLPVTYPSIHGPATLSGNTLTFTGAGVVAVKCRQGGDATYAPATDLTVTLTVAKAPQTITLPKATPAYLGTPYTLAATATSGLPVTYPVVYGPATISGNTLTFTGVGAVTVKCRQSGNATYSPAADATFRLNVVKVAQTITFPHIGTVKAGQVVTLVATSTSGLPITYTVAAGTGVVTGNTVTFSATGLATITANQAGNDTVAAAKAVSQNASVR